MTTAVSNAILVAALAIPVYCICRWWRRPAVTHALYLLLLLKLLTPPLVRIPLPWNLDHVAPRIAAWITEDKLATDVPLPSAAGMHSDGPVEASGNLAVALDHADRTVSEIDPSRTLGVRIVQWCHSLRGGDLLRGLLAVWLLGSVVLALGVTRKAWAFRRRLQSGHQSSHPLQIAVNELARERQLRRGPPAVFIDRPVSPMLWGVGPCVWLVFPRELWNRIADAERRTLLLHELGHFVRRDPWVRLIELVASILFWWHPVVWWALREIERTGEECCDALVLDWEDAPRTYAEAIVSTLDFLADRSAVLPPLASGVSDVPALKLRLTQIMHREVSPRLSDASRRLVLTAGIVTILLHPFFPLAPPPPVNAAVTLDVWPAATPPSGKGEMTKSFPDAVSATGKNATVPPPASAATNVPELPAPPRGWWTPAADRRWAESISPNRAWRLSAHAGHRITLESLVNPFQRDLHFAEITAVAWLPRGDQFVAGLRTGQVQLWDADRGEPLSTLGNPGVEIRSIAVDPAGRTAVTGSVDGAVLLWDIGSGAIIGAWRTPSESAIVCVRYSPNRSEIVVGAGDWRSPQDSRVLILDAETAESVAMLVVPGSLAVCGFDESNRVYVADWSGQVSLWDEEFQVLVPQGRTTATQLAAASFSPEGKLWPER